MPQCAAPKVEINLIGTEGQVLCERCEIADELLSRGRGLLGRKTLPRTATGS